MLFMVYFITTLLNNYFVLTVYMLSYCALFYLQIHQGLQDLPCHLWYLSNPSPPVILDHPVTRGENSFIT